MKRNDLFRSIRQMLCRCPVAGMLTVILMIVAATGCADDADSDNRLPDGKYPITFTAVVDGLTLTRTATTENKWTGGEEVAIRISKDPGTPAVKKYKADTNGNLADTDAANVIYWQNTTESYNVSAWYPYNSGNKPTTFTVQTDQSGDGYQTSDCLLAQSTTVTFSRHTLTFKHLPAKVVANLKCDATLTADEVTGATVSILNQATTSGEIAEDGTVAQVTPGTNATITPHACATVASGYQQSVQALLVPQQMQGKRFIKVTIGKDAAARDYFYTPTGDNDANLTAGQQYTYNITVKKEGLQVEPVSASWTDNTPTIDTPTEATFQVYLPESHGQTLTVNQATQVGTSNVYEINNHGNSFSISYTPADADKANGFLIAKGLGDCKRTVNNGTYTFTYSNIRSDLWLSYTLYSEVGYYYYSDGTCSDTYNSGSSPTCIGIVFKTGAGEGDEVSNYAPSTFTDNVIHGYVIALQDAYSGALAWSTEQITTGASISITALNGYSNTQTLKTLGGNDFVTKYPAAYHCVNYSTTAATISSSGWYLPSYAQMKAFKEARDANRINFRTASGSDLRSNKDYWTSTERTSSSVWHYYTGNGLFYNDNRKNETNRYVRAILTF